MATSHLAILTLLFLSLSSLSHAAERCHPNDKKALLQIKKDLKNPYVLTSWNPKTDCCDWYVVKCDAKTNRITQFFLTKTNLNLPIPAAVGDLTHLQILSLHKINVTGEIPRAISKLSDLTLLDLQWNLLTGPVPAFLGHLKNLTNVILSFNSLTGSIPASFSQLPKLTGLFLDRNRLTGSIPETFADFKNEEISLYLSHNELSGPIPRKLGNANFSSIDVSTNKLEGDISFLFGKKKSLVIGDFSRNRFEFDMTKVEFSEALTNLDLNHNKIYGSLPEDLSRTGIIGLNVSYNRLCGPIPELRRLQTFDYTTFFHNKCLCGKPLSACK
ncbi:polygalacturonase inhibiting protein 1 [Perilla frutescens var. frutescens]|nr:polygalacturonase inhibiting protein 1 [Perilla frutescens var. frutescens]